MDKIDWVRKLTSRKMWAAIALFVSGVMTATGASASQAETIAGLIMQGAAVIAYIIGEGLVDGANKEIGEGIEIGEATEIKDVEDY